MIVDKDFHPGFGFWRTTFSLRALKEPVLHDAARGQRAGARRSRARKRPIPPRRFHEVSLNEYQRGSILRWRSGAGDLLFHGVMR